MLMNTITIFSLIVAIGSLFTSLLTIYVSKQIAASSGKANILFFIEKNISSNQFECVLKNFGSNIGLLMELKITPNLDYQKSRYKMAGELPYITDNKNIYLTPNQEIRTEFPFTNYPDKEFDIAIKYKSFDNYSKNVIYLNKYSIDLRYLEKSLYFKDS